MTFGKKCPKCGYINQPEKHDCWLCESGDLREVKPEEHSGTVPNWARKETNNSEIDAATAVRENGAVKYTVAWLVGAIAFFIFAIWLDPWTAFKYGGFYRLGSALSPWIWASVIYGVVRLFTGAERAPDTGLFVMKAAAVFYFLVGFSLLSQSISSPPEESLSESILKDCRQKYEEVIDTSVSNLEVQSYCSCYSQTLFEGQTKKQLRKLFFVSQSPPKMSELRRQVAVSCGVGPIFASLMVHDLDEILPMKVEEGIVLTKADRGENQITFFYEIDSEVIDTEEIRNRENLITLKHESSSIMCGDEDVRSMLDYGIVIKYIYVDSIGTELYSFNVATSDCT